MEGLAEASLAVAEHLKKQQAVNPGTVNPDIVMGKPYYEFYVDREEAARYGMTTMMVNQIVSAGLGGVAVTTTVEGRERYPIQVRYAERLGVRLGFRCSLSNGVVKALGMSHPGGSNAERRYPAPFS